ncbi:MAG TPA: AAA family ATPase [Candidatus Nitrosotalea sp.]|nr:AAA family ATPase [Candidatus Nitrosotalea sp.]
MKRAGSRKTAASTGLFLTGLRRGGARREPDRFPFTLPLFRALERLDLRARVTFLVGENGCGKSTLLEGLAAGAEAVAAGGRDLERDPTLAPARTFARAFRFQRARHPRVTLFLRAEDVFGFTQRVRGQMDELRSVEDELRTTLRDGSWGQRLAVGAAAKEHAALVRRYGADPDARSHGETFLHLLQQRLQPRGLYFLDEPETPLSPTRVLALLAILRDRVAHDCQFVIATHSPILMALPKAEILRLEDGAIAPVAYEDVEHVRITRAFLDDPDSFLRRL